MTEASVSSAFMSALRKRLPDAVIVKLRDASFIGLPDCSITFRRYAFFVEFKLWQPQKRWDGKCDVQKIAEKSPVQFEMMKRLYRSAMNAWYIVWAKKTGRCFVWLPRNDTPYGEEISQDTLVELMAGWMENLCDSTK